MQHQRVLVLDFGGQYNQLIARRVREQGVYCDLVPFTTSIDKIREYAPIGIIFHLHGRAEQRVRGGRARRGRGNF